MITQISKLRRLTLAFIIALLAISTTYLTLSQAEAAPGDYTISYVNGNTTYTKSYAPGSVVTLDALPSGAIAWTNDSDPSAPNGKMAYVNYSHADTTNGGSVQVNIPMMLTLNSDITLNANYGSYAGGQQGPRLIQFHLELKFFDMTNNAMMQYEPHYNNINAPSGYYIALPPANYFGSLWANTGSGSLTNTGKYIGSWVNDASYTGTTTPPASSIFDPGALIYVDPNNYNMIYDVMVTPTVPAPASSPETITFRISQTSIPPASIQSYLLGNPANPVVDGGTFVIFWPTDHPPDSMNLIAGVYLNWYSGQAQITLSGLQATDTWAAALPPTTLPTLGPVVVLPAAVNVAGYTWYWDIDGTNIPVAVSAAGNDESLPTYMSSGGINTATPIGGSHIFTLHYEPVVAASTIQLYVDGFTEDVIYDGAQHSVTGYDVYDCSGVGTIDSENPAASGCTTLGSNTTGVGAFTMTNGAVLNLSATGNSNIIATGTDVGTYPLNLMVGDFTVTNTGGNLYNITTSSGGLTITQKDLPIIVTPPIDPNTPGDQTVVVTPSNPGDLAPGDEIITPGTDVTPGPGSGSTTDGDTTVVINVGGDGDITYIDPKTDKPIPYDPTLPNGGIIWIGDTGSDPPTNVTNNYVVTPVLPNPDATGNLPKTGNMSTDINLSAVSFIVLLAVAAMVIVAQPTIAHKLRKESRIV